MSVVYFIACNDAVKIGTAVNVTSRFNTLQIGNPDPLCLLGAIPGDEILEKALHRRFKHLRIRGEWFRNTDELAAFIEAGFEDLPYRLFGVDDEFFGFLGAAPYEKSFYRVYVRSGDQWWRFQWNACVWPYDPIKKQELVPRAARAETVYSSLGDLQGYTCDPTRAGLLKLFKRIESFR
jgi:hypothetical protein